MKAAFPSLGSLTSEDEKYCKELTFDRVPREGY